MTFDLVTTLTAVALATTGALYGRGVRALLARRRQRIVLVRAGAFALGWATLAIALLSPLAAVSEWLFSAHMTQHTLLMLVAAPLVVGGQPVATVMAAFGRGGLGQFAVRTRPLWRAATGPAASFLVLLGVLWIWHVPVLHEAALHSDAVHVVQHLSFLAAASAFWWGLVHGRYGRRGYGLAVVFVFLTAVHSSVLGALLTVASRVLYPTYATRGIAHHVDALGDQQIAGLIMWVPSGVIFILIGIALFAAWLGEAERQAKLGRVEAAGRTADVRPALDTAHGKPR
jgi:putative membrane protein